MNTLFTFILFASAASPLDMQLEVRSTQVNYSVVLTKQQFVYQSSTKQIEKKILPCAARAYELFAQKIENNIKTDLATTPIKTPKAIEVTLNKKKYFIPPLSTAGVAIAKVDTEVDYLLSEAVYRCSKK